VRSQAAHHDGDDGTKQRKGSIMRRLDLIFFGLIAMVFLASALSSPPSGTPTPVVAGSTASVYPESVLSSASAMTQQMSVPGVITGHEYHPHSTDQQLQLSLTSPEFVRELENYQRQLDRSLARTP